MNDLRTASYWIGHFFGIAATVAGVYLAASVGFDTALKLELVKADRGTYYVAESLHQELQFNVQNMDKYIERVKDKPNVFREHIAGIKLNDYIFQASKYSESTFEIEPSLLTEVSIFYFSVGNVINNYYATGQQSPQPVMQVVKREMEKLQKQGTLQKLAAYNKALGESVEEQGVPLSLTGS